MTENSLILLSDKFFMHMAILLYSDEFVLLLFVLVSFLLLWWDTMAKLSYKMKNSCGFMVA